MLKNPVNFPLFVTSNGPNGGHRIIKNFDLSSWEETTAGYVLQAILYSSLTDVLTQKEYYGCPHHGGMHTLVLKTSKDDANAFIDLCEDIIRKAYGEKRFQKFIKGFKELRLKIVA